MAKCGKCGTSENLLVWSIPDPYNGYPLLPEIICENCPCPTDIFKDSKSTYDPDFHDEMFGLADFSVGFAYTFHGNRVITGLCFECDGSINMSNGYGHCYVPDILWRGRDYSAVIYCEPCHRLRCKNHLNFDQKEEADKLKLKLDVYWEKTVNGELVSIK